LAKGEPADFYQGSKCRSLAALGMTTKPTFHHPTQTKRRLECGNCYYPTQAKRRLEWGTPARTWDTKPRTPLKSKEGLNGASRNPGGLAQDDSIGSGEQLQEFLRGIVESGEDRIEIPIPQMLKYCLADHATKIGAQREIAAFVELLGSQSRPLAVDAAATHRAADHKHCVGVTVVSPTVAIFPHRAAEFRHGDDHGVFCQVAQVNPKGRQ